jgi:hypothetical protein
MSESSLEIIYRKGAEAQSDIPISFEPLAGSHAVPSCGQNPGSGAQDPQRGRCGSTCLSGQVKTSLLFAPLRLCAFAVKNFFI